MTSPDLSQAISSRRVVKTAAGRVNVVPRLGDSFEWKTESVRRPRGRGKLKRDRYNLLHPAVTIDDASPSAYEAQAYRQYRLRADMPFYEAKKCTFSHPTFHEEPPSSPPLHEADRVTSPLAGKENRSNNPHLSEIDWDADDWTSKVLNLGSPSSSIQHFRRGVGHSKRAQNSPRTGGAVSDALKQFGYSKKQKSLSTFVESQQNSEQMNKKYSSSNHPGNIAEPFSPSAILAKESNEGTPSWRKPLKCPKRRDSGRFGRLHSGINVPMMEHFEGMKRKMMMFGWSSEKDQHFHHPEGRADATVPDAGVSSQSIIELDASQRVNDPANCNSAQSDLVPDIRDRLPEFENDKPQLGFVDKRDDPSSGSQYFDFFADDERCDIFDSITGGFVVKSIDGGGKSRAFTCGDDSIRLTDDVDNASNNMYTIDEQQNSSQSHLSVENKSPPATLDSNVKKTNLSVAEEKTTAASSPCLPLYQTLPFTSANYSCPPVPSNDRHLTPCSTNQGASNLVKPSFKDSKVAPYSRYSVELNARADRIGKSCGGKRKDIGGADDAGKICPSDGERFSASSDGTGADRLLLNSANIRTRDGVNCSLDKNSAISLSHSLNHFQPDSHKSLSGRGSEKHENVYSLSSTPFAQTSDNNYLILNCSLPAALETCSMNRDCDLSDAQLDRQSQCSESAQISTFRDLNTEVNYSPVNSGYCHSDQIEQSPDMTESSISINSSTKCQKLRTTTTTGLLPQSSEDGSSRSLNTMLSNHSAPARKAQQLLQSGFRPSMVDLLSPSMAKHSGKKSDSCPNRAYSSPTLCTPPMIRQHPATPVDHSLGRAGISDSVPGFCHKSRRSVRTPNANQFPRSSSFDSLLMNLPPSSSDIKHRSGRNDGHLSHSGRDIVSSNGSTIAEDDPHRRRYPAVVANRDDCNSRVATDYYNDCNQSKDLNEDLSSSWDNLRPDFICTSPGVKMMGDFNDALNGDIFRQNSAIYYRKLSSDSTSHSRSLVGDARRSHLKSTKTASSASSPLVNCFQNNLDSNCVRNAFANGDTLSRQFKPSAHTSRIAPPKLLDLPHLRHLRGEPGAHKASQSRSLDDSFTCDSARSSGIIDMGVIGCSNNASVVDMVSIWRDNGTDLVNGSFDNESPTGRPTSNPRIFSPSTLQGRTVNMKDDLVNLNTSLAYGDIREKSSHSALTNDFPCDSLSMDLDDQQTGGLGMTETLERSDQNDESGTLDDFQGAGIRQDRQSSADRGTSDGSVPFWIDISAKYRLIRDQDNPNQTIGRFSAEQNTDFRKENRHDLNLHNRQTANSVNYDVAAKHPLIVGDANDGVRPIEDTSKLNHSNIDETTNLKHTEQPEAGAGFPNHSEPSRNVDESGQSLESNIVDRGEEGMVATGRAIGGTSKCDAAYNQELLETDSMRICRSSQRCEGESRLSGGENFSTNLSEDSPPMDFP